MTGYNGRRGAQLVAQPKTSVPVSLKEARRIFDGLESAKLNHPKTPYKIAERQSGTTTTGTKQKEGVAPPAPASTSVAETSTQQSSSEDYRASHLDALEF